LAGSQGLTSNDLRAEVGGALREYVGELRFAVQRFTGDHRHGDSLPETWPERRASGGS